MPEPLTIATPGIRGIAFSGDDDSSMRLRSVTVRSTHGARGALSSTSMWIDNDELVLEVRGILKNVRLPLHLVAAFIQQEGGLRVDA